MNNIQLGIILIYIVTLGIITLTQLRMLQLLKQNKEILNKKMIIEELELMKNIKRIRTHLSNNNQNKKLKEPKEYLTKNDINNEYQIKGIDSNKNVIYVKNK